MKISFFGAGRVVSWQLERFKQYEELEVLGFYDVDGQRSNDLISKGYKSFSSLSDLVKSESDIIVISTPSNLHYSSLLELIKENIQDKVITIEKPTFLKQEEYFLVEKLIKNNSLTILPVFQNRYNRAVQLVKSHIEKGDLGDLMNGRIILSWCRPQRYFDQADWRGKWHSDGGALTNQGIHFIDVARYLFGEVENVSFRMDRANINIECENVAVGSMRLRSGRLVSVDISTTSRPIDDLSEISIYGTNGFISIGGLAMNKIKNNSFNIKNNFDEDIPNGYGYGHEKFYLHLSNIIHKSDFSSILSDMTEARKTSAILNAAYSSSANGGKIVSTNGYFEEILGYTPESKIVFK